MPGGTENKGMCKDGPNRMHKVSEGWSGRVCKDSRERAEGVHEVAMEAWIQGRCTRSLTQIRKTAQVSGTGRESGCIDGGDLSQQLATFPAGFPADFLRKLARKLAKSDHVTTGIVMGRVNQLPKAQIMIV